MKAEFVSRDNLDDDRWDDCVRRVSNSRHYYLTKYLDAACNEWEALIDPSYTWIWPLPFKRFPVKRVFQPLLTQQLGPIGDNLSDDQLFHLGSLISKKYKKGSIKFNDSFQKVPFSNVLQHRNLELDLESSYDAIRASYNRNAMSNLKKAERNEIKVIRYQNLNPWIIETFRTTTGKTLHLLDKAFYAQVQSIYSAFQSDNRAWCFEASKNDEIMAQALVLEHQNRLLYFFSASSHDGRSLGASQALVDAIVKQYAGENWTLDFEGSDQEGLAYFYQSFGARERIYLQSSWSRLPRFLNAFLK